MVCAFFTLGEGTGGAPSIGRAPAFLLAPHWTWLMGEPSFSRAPLGRALRSLPTGGRRGGGSVRSGGAWGLQQATAHLPRLLSSWGLGSSLSLC